MRIAGSILLVGAAVGFVIVADDLRHVGEVAGVASLAIAGAALVAASIPSPFSRSLALPWIAAAVLAAALIGVVIDRMALSVCAGAVVGLPAALLRR